MQYSKTIPINTPAGPAAVCIGRNCGQVWAWCAPADMPRHRWPGAADYRGDCYNDPTEIDLCAVFPDGYLLDLHAMPDSMLANAIADFLEEDSDPGELAEDVAAKLNGIARDIDQILSECDIPNRNLALLASHIRLEAERLETPKDTLGKLQAGAAAMRTISFLEA